MSVLVTGGAGYIGSHTVIELLAAGESVVIADNFSNSSPIVLDRLEQITGTRVPCYEIDVADREALTQLFAAEQIDSVIHFAGLKSVGESVAIPLKYYDVNLNTTLVLLDVMQQFGVYNLVFSSSATVYGSVHQPPYVEELSTSSVNPYGWTKVMTEQILRDVQQTDDKWAMTALRYFNPIGAHETGLIGENPIGIPNNLMPYIAQVAVGKRACLQVFGNDYDTVDGTGVRDYIHVVDLAKGHVSALKQQRQTPGFQAINLGTGQGTSVLELVHAFEQASGRPVKYEIVARREGDVATSYADATKAKQLLGWQAEKTIADMCADSWRWQSQNPNGYDAHE